MVELGVDQHKRFSQMATLDTETGVVTDARLDHDDPEAIRSFVASLGPQVKASIETTGNWYWLADLLEDEGAQVQLANTTETRRLLKARAKNDRLDALALAELSSEGILPTVYLPARAQRDERECHRFRIRLIAVQTVLKNIAHSILGKLNVATPFSDMFGKAGRAYLDQLELREPYESQFRSILRLLDAMKPEVERATREIVRWAREHPLAGLLQTAPGIAELTAYLILHEVGPVERFPTHKEFVSYCCLAPGTWQSASKVRDLPVGRHGNLYLKAAMTGAVPMAVRSDGTLAHYYAKTTRRKGKSTALVATARRLAVAVYHMLKERQPYQPPRESNRRVGKPLSSLGHSR
jgi:transposase